MLSTTCLLSALLVLVIAAPPLLAVDPRLYQPHHKEGTSLQGQAWLLPPGVLAASQDQGLDRLGRRCAYIDSNCNGDLTEEGERVPRSHPVAEIEFPSREQGRSPFSQGLS
jgi:hypothetical protein